MKTAIKAFRTFLSTLAPASNESLEAFLAESHSLADLERREQQWHRASSERALFSIGVRSH